MSFYYADLHPDVRQFVWQARKSANIKVIHNEDEVDARLYYVYASQTPDGQGPVITSLQTNVNYYIRDSPPVAKTTDENNEIVCVPLGDGLKQHQLVQTNKRKKNPTYDEVYRNVKTLSTRAEKLAELIVSWEVETEIVTLSTKQPKPPKDNTSSSQFRTSSSYEETASRIDYNQNYSCDE
jgi:hypothetical protein